MALLPGSWQKHGDTYTGTLLMLPDRGWNTQGTTDYHARIHRFSFKLTPNMASAPRGQIGLDLEYNSSLMLRDAEGALTTGLDATAIRPGAGDFPDLPAASNGHVSLDDEGLAVGRDGTFWVSDEYGPYIYHFDAKGRMMAAIRPPDALIPMRTNSNGARENFSADSPPVGAGKKSLGEPQSGRQNNQGFEGLSISKDGRHLFAILQSAAVQDVDPNDIKATRRYTRLLTYDISGRPKLIHEFVVPLPLYSTGQGMAVAAQSEMLALDEHRFLLLCRDSNGGFTGKRDASLFRQVELVNTAGATDIAGTAYDAVGGAVAPGGRLDPGVKPARLEPFLDINDNTQLGRFGLHNGSPNDRNDLYEKWESLAIADTGDGSGDYFLFVGSDNDFITQHGVLNGKPYQDGSGQDVDTLVLVWRVKLPSTQ